MEYFNINYKKIDLVLHAQLCDLGMSYFQNCTAFEKKNFRHFAN